jgi:hypothetical protein
MSNPRFKDIGVHIANNVVDDGIQYDTKVFIGGVNMYIEYHQIGIWSYIVKGGWFICGFRKVI